MSNDITGQPAAVAPQPKAYDRAKDDAKIESQFLTYLLFGLQINWNCMRALLEKARLATEGSLLQKSFAIQNHPEELKTLPKTIKARGPSLCYGGSRFGSESQGLTTLLD